MHTYEQIYLCIYSYISIYIYTRVLSTCIFKTFSLYGTSSIHFSTKFTQRVHLQYRAQMSNSKYGQLLI